MRPSRAVPSRAASVGREIVFERAEVLAAPAAAAAASSLFRPAAVPSDPPRTPPEEASLARLFFAPLQVERAGLACAVPRSGGTTTTLTRPSRIVLPRRAAVAVMPYVPGGRASPRKRPVNRTRFWPACPGTRNEPTTKQFGATCRMVNVTRAGPASENVRTVPFRPAAGPPFLTTRVCEIWRSRSRGGAATAPPASPPPEGEAWLDEPPEPEPEPELEPEPPDPLAPPPPPSPVRPPTVFETEPLTESTTEPTVPPTSETEGA